MDLTVSSLWRNAFAGRPYKARDGERGGNAGAADALDREPDWDAVYAEQLPRVYNFFRYRCGPRADVEGSRTP
jgi:hypothetical protein